MSSLTIQQIMGSKFRTSSSADAQTKELMEHLGLSTKAAVARLAIGRSLGCGPLGTTEAIDSKGLEIPATSLFRQEDVTAWVGLLLTHEIRATGTVVDDMEGFRNLVRRHWHRGAKLLTDDWEGSSRNYDAFISTLVTRRAELSDDAESSPLTEGSPAPEDLEDSSAALAAALAEMGVSAEIRGVTHGPRVSRYKVALRDVRKLEQLRRSLEPIALALNLYATPSVSLAREPKVVFLDVPRPEDQWQIFQAAEFSRALESIPADRNKLVACAATDIMGKPTYLNLTSAPHLLVAGATGMGKSVCVHALLVSLLTSHDKSSLLLALIDPKQVEFSVYENLKCLWGNRIAAGAESAGSMLDDLVVEMEDRYRALREIGVSNIVDGRNKGLKLPFIVVCVDELADLLLQDEDAETSLARLAQMGRACGIHLILATQRPDSKTISGLIRSNVPARIALRVQKSTESTIILDETGAEYLLGKGDMLIKTSGEPPTRAHGYFLTLPDVEKMIARK